MAINATTNWRIRVSGSNTNGGGFDSAIASAGTDYTEQDSSQLALTDLTTSGAGSTTLTSIVGGFTTAMIGNCVRIRSGTNFQTGYYFITARADTNNVTLDRTPTSGGAGLAGAGDVGGAFATFEPLMGTGNNGLSSPAITSPLAAGHQINVRGSGSDDPGSADYDYKGSAAAYQGYYGSNANGSTSAGKIKVVGYNGRPYINYSGLLFLSASLWHLENLKLVRQSTGTGWDTYGVFDNDSATLGNSLRNCIIDLNGKDGIGVCCSEAIDVEVRNTGGGAAGTGCGIILDGFGTGGIGCYVDSVRGDGYRVTQGAQSFVFCVARNCGRDGFRVTYAGTGLYSVMLFACTANNNTSDGIEVTAAGGISILTVLNCIIANNGGYGLNLSTGSTALNDRSKRVIDYNNYYTNTSGAVNNVSQGANDTTLDPQFTNASSEDYSVGTNMKATGFPGAFRGSSSTGYLDKGAVQRQEGSGSGVAPAPRIIQNIGTY